MIEIENKIFAASLRRGQSMGPVVTMGVVNAVAAIVAAWVTIAG